MSTFTGEANHRKREPEEVAMQPLRQILLHHLLPPDAQAKRSREAEAILLFTLPKDVRQQAE